MLLHQLKYKPLHVAMAVSLTLHISIAFDLLSTKKTQPTERVNIAGTRSFDTFIIRPSVVKVVTNQSAESKAQAAEPSVTKVETNEPVTTAASESDQVQYRSSSFSRFGRSRPMERMIWLLHLINASSGSKINLRQLRHHPTSKVSVL